jgi:hypothetical protein
VSRSRVVPPSASAVDPSAGTLGGSPVLPTSVDGLRARVVLDPDDLQVLSFVRTEDARTALSRGLAEYLAEQSVVWEGGRLLAFARVTSVWADQEVPAKYPSAAVVAVEDATYDASNLTPVLVQAEDGTKRYLRQAAELMQKFALTVWAADSKERTGCVALCEDALEPAEFMTGLRLELPYYWNARATYEKVSLSYEDSAADAHRRWRKAVISVTASVPQYRPVGALPVMRVRRQVEVDGVAEVRG